VSATRTRGPTATAGEAGQAAIELLVLLPLIVAAAFAAAAILSFEGTRERAGEAARAGAMALLQDEDAAAAARASLGDDRHRADVHLQGRRVTVAIAPPAPLRVLLPHLSARASADAGPEPRP
jgi:hypothetical protein